MKIRLLFILLTLQVTSFSQVVVKDSYVKCDDAIKFVGDSAVSLLFNDIINSEFKYPDEVLMSGLDGQGIIQIEFEQNNGLKIQNLNTKFDYDFYTESFNGIIEKTIKSMDLCKSGRIGLVLIVNFYLPNKSEWNSKEYDKKTYLESVNADTKSLDDYSKIKMPTISKLNSVSKYDPLDYELNEIWLKIYTDIRNSEDKKKIEELIDLTKNFSH